MIARGYTHGVWGAVRIATPWVQPVGVSLGGGYHDIQRKGKRLNAQKADLKHRQQLVEQIETIKMQSEQAHIMTEPIRSLLFAGSNLRRRKTNERNVESGYMKSHCD